MGFPWGKKDQSGKEDGKGGDANAPSFRVTKDSPSAASTPEIPAQASSVFEFGAVVPAGKDFMRGVCIGDDPDAIQACTWSVETAQRGRDKTHLYRIEF
mmetsp:Transcript_43738/g.131103  ORF Transcript_43738/g.131103 Transcript_43738/m.131103 type:complete len:99 (+) Transcript_43738:59-355(+)|eukprot:364558-Chlamydomonas_euryale.AAC.9